MVLPDAANTELDRLDRGSKGGEKSGIFANIPAGKLTTLRLRLRSNSEADQEVARERCKEFGIDYEQAKKEASK